MRKVLALLVALILITIPTGSALADDVIVSPGEWEGNDNGIVWINTQIGYLIYEEPDATPRLAWSKTLDGGTNWTVPTTIDSACDVGTFGVWYDRWTKGSIGTEIHMAWHRNPQSGDNCGGPSNIYYDSLDTANDVLSGTVTAATVTGYGGDCQAGGNPCELTITRAKGGNLYIHAQLTTSSNQQRVLASTNGGATWATRSLGLSGVSFIGPLAPFNADNDILIGDGLEVSQDIVAFDYTNLRYLLYDYSANTWISGGTFTGTGSNCSVSAGAGRKCFTRAVNPTGVAISPTGTGAVFFGHLNGASLCLSGSCNFQVFKMDTAAVMTEVTPVFTARSNITNIELSFDGNSGNLYAFYLNHVLDEVYYRVSDDYGATWGTEVVFDTSANAKTDVISAPTFAQSGAQLIPVWEEGAPLDLVTEFDSVIELAAEEPPPDEQEFPNMLERFVSGLGLSGGSGQLAFAGLCGFLLAFIGILTRMPAIVLLSLETVWFGLMTLVDFVSPGLYISMLVVIGLMMVFAILRKLGSSTSEEEF